MTKNGSEQPPQASRDDAAIQHEAFVRLFAQHVTEVQAYINALLPQRADADDVFQQTSITIWRKFSEFQPGTNFPAWACTIALNLVRNYRRVESRRPVFLVDDDVLEAIGQTQREQSAQVNARREALTACLEKLAAHDRDLIARCYGDSSRLKDVAADLGRTANAVYKRLQIIRRSIFDCVIQTLAAEEIRP